METKAKPKPKRKRPVHFNFWATEKEAALIRRRMADTGFVGIGAYLRKVGIDGRVVKVDIDGLRELTALLRRCSNNLNQYAKRANETRSVYEADIQDLRQRLDGLWEVANGILDGVLRIK